MKHFILVVALLLVPVFAFSHEQWFLTGHQMHDLLNHPRPKLFSELNQTNVSILLTVIFTIVILFVFQKKAANEFFPEHQKKLTALSHYVPLFIRLTTAGMLLLAVFGMNPRHGAELFTTPTFIFPDLQLTSLSGYWSSLVWAELILALGLLFGIYTRLMGSLLLFISTLALFHFKMHMFCYYGFIVGISLYLIFQGGGVNYAPLPVPKITQKAVTWFQEQPVHRAQALLLFFTGLDFALTGFICKFIFPNVAIGLLTQQHMPTFGLNMETIVLWMAIIETFAGVFLMLNILVRPIAFILMGCFIFLANAINEALYSHLIFFGVLIACYINGAGRWRISAKDKPARIVIVGASLSGIYSAMELEKIRGKNSNVEVTLIHNQNYFQFGPLLSSIISGTIQPTNIITFIRQICPSIHFIQGSVKKINCEDNSLTVNLLYQQECTINYDQLIISQEENNLSSTELYEKTIPINNVEDALFIRKHIFECLEQADVDEINRESLLTFVIAGSGLRSISVATEIYNLIKYNLVFYPYISLNDIKIMVLSQKERIVSDFSHTFYERLKKKLTKMGIEIIQDELIHSLIDNEITLSSNAKIKTYTVINAISPTGQLVPINNTFRVMNYKNIFSTSISAFASNKIPFQALFETQIGKLVAYNAWANTQNRPLKIWNKNVYYFNVVCLNQYCSILKIGNVIINGWSAWVLSRLMCVMLMPGLEKNLRLIIDWLFNIPFRPNTCTFTTVTSKPSEQVFSIDKGNK